MASNHGFADGNKRTTLILTHSLITNSNYKLDPLPGEDIEQAIENLILAAASRGIDMDGLTDWFQQRLRGPLRKTLSKE